MLDVQYHYQVLNQENEITLSRHTSETTYHRIGLIDVTWRQGIFDDILLMRGMAKPESEQYFKEMTKEWEEYKRN